MQMEFGMNKKIKIALVCHFSSEYIQNKLPLWKNSNVFAAWISNTLEGFKYSKEFEIHVIAPHQYLKRDYSFEEEGIFYHFYKTGMPILSRGWPSFFNLDLHTNFYSNRKKIRKLVDKIQPNLINLHGAENSYYSSSALDLYKNYPILITIQGFISLEINSQNDLLRQNRIDTEYKIIRNCSHFGGDKDSRIIIKKMRNTDFNFYNFYYPNGSYIDKLSEKIVVKDFDLLFWGRIIKDKGAEDFLCLVAKLCVFCPDLKACYIGPSSSEYIGYLQAKAIELGCERNICFKGFINNNDELYAEVLKSKILVLPTYNDRFPTVLREAVCLKIAVIGYSTGSIPEFNKDDERILLADQGDIEKLYTHAKKLLTDEKYFDYLTQKAYYHGLAEFSIANNCNRMASAYKDILKI